MPTAEDCQNSLQAKLTGGWLAAVIEVLVLWWQLALGPSKGPPRHIPKKIPNLKVAQNGVLGGTLHIGSQLATIAYY